MSLMVLDLGRFLKYEPSFVDRDRNLIAAIEEQKKYQALNSTNNQAQNHKIHPCLPIKTRHEMT